MKWCTYLNVHRLTFFLSIRVKLLATILHENETSILLVLIDRQTTNKHSLIS